DAGGRVRPLLGLRRDRGMHIAKQGGSLVERQLGPACVTGGERLDVGVELRLLPRGEFGIGCCGGRLRSLIRDGHGISFDRVNSLALCCSDCTMHSEPAGSWQGRWVTEADIVLRLRSAGCVFAEQEAALLIAEAADAGDLERMVARRVAGE